MRDAIRIRCLQAAARKRARHEKAAHDLTWGRRKVKAW